jgi:hypothetical protein|tara:strand:+ start:13359 stop:15155 length:1797 start_codon:yes stop_codon:yes gene_type:complete
MPKKLQSIDYTSRDFDSIRKDLENYAKRYYPNTYKDFSEASFGSLMLDTVSYVGDILSFYVDYQANESFLDSAIQYSNVVRHARQFGFRLPSSPSSYGLLTFYIKVPAASVGGGPDLRYAGVLKAGSLFGSGGGGSYTLLEDVDFATPTNQMVAGEANATNGNTTSYIIRALGRAVSGHAAVEEREIGNFQRFLKVSLSNTNVADILSVVDTEGHEYFQVDNLSQNIIYKAIRNSGASRSAVPSILKAVPVARRFVLEQTSIDSYLQFGYGSDSELLSNTVLDPTNLMLDLNGRDYITDADFDPTKLISTDKFGIAPSNTKLRISYRLNSNRDVNSAINTINAVNSANFKFRDQASLTPDMRNTVVASLEVTNEQPFVGNISLPSSTEVKERVRSYFATQNRAVTAQDYQAIVYAMPGKFGSVFRARIVKDFAEFKRNLNLYVISTDTSAKLIAANSALKGNVKNWITQYKMINDTIDILDAEIVNFGIKYQITLESNANRYTVISRASTRLASFYNDNPYDIGERLLITDVYRELLKVKGVLDVYDVQIVPKQGGPYSESNYDFQSNMSADGRSINAAETTIFELKFPNNDIQGSIR